jgi:biotin operon repressor
MMAPSDRAVRESIMAEKATTTSRRKATDVKKPVVAHGGRLVIRKAASPISKKSMAASMGKGSAGAGYAVELPRGPRGQIAMLAIRGVLDRVADVPEREVERVLADARRAAEPEARVMDWLRVEDRDRPATESALEAAYRRGDQRKAAILRDPAMLTGEAAAGRLGVSRETINKRAQQGKLLALEFAKRGRRYPQWQFEESIAGQPLESVLAALGSRDPWEQYRFFAQPQPRLGGRTPVESLRRGEVEAVQRAAQGWAAGEQGGG